jgi:hypothetical protein
MSARQGGSEPQCSKKDGQCAGTTSYLVDADLGRRILQVVLTMT